MGLAVGDALGAPYEGGFVERQLWRLIGRTPQGKKRYTDDTQMSIDVARSFLKEGILHQESLAQAFASSYRWSRGYGPSAAKILKGIRKGKSWRDLNRQRLREVSFGKWGRHEGFGGYFVPPLERRSPERVRHEKCRCLD